MIYFWRFESRNIASPFILLLCAQQMISSEPFNKALLDSPEETERQELKSWVDISSREAKAELAKDLAALANFGGGFIIFGFDDRTFAPLPYTRTSISIEYNHNSITDIVKTYLEPSFQCLVSIEKSSAGSVHVVVQVPSHGVTPVCVKKEAARPDGTSILTKGVHYTRKPKPESAAISTPLEWQPIIKRCLLADRTNLLRDFAEILDIARGDARKNDPGVQFRTVADATRQSFLQSLNVPKAKNAQ